MSWNKRTLGLVLLVFSFFFHFFLPGRVTKSFPPTSEGYKQESTIDK